MSALLAILAGAWKPIAIGVGGLLALLMARSSGKARAERDAARADYDKLHKINEATREKLDPDAARARLDKRLHERR